MDMMSYIYFTELLRLMIEALVEENQEKPDSDIRSILDDLYSSREKIIAYAEIDEYEPDDDENTSENKEIDEKAKE